MAIEPGVKFVNTCDPIPLSTTVGVALVRLWRAKIDGATPAQRTLFRVTLKKRFPELAVGILLDDIEKYLPV
jgi:hypothetical protein